MYGEVPPENLYGRGFTIWSRAIEDIPRSPDNFKDVDIVIYGNVRRQRTVDWRVLVNNREFAPKVIYLDGNDDNNIDPEFRPCYKRELHELRAGVFPIGFSIPDRLVRDVNIHQKTQLFQASNQDPELTKHASAYDFKAPEFRREGSYVFSEEREYYDDLARSHFGITMKKAGWDCMRHYEILAAGTLVMFKHFDDKPTLCAPRCPHFLTYSNNDELMSKVHALLPMGHPSEEYHQILAAQRQWLTEHATSSSQARRLIEHVRGLPASQSAFKPLGAAMRGWKLVQLFLYLVKEQLIFNGVLLKRRNPKLDELYRGILNQFPIIRRYVSTSLHRERPSSPE